MNISDNGVKLIKGFEGLRLESYLDSVGVWTIGYGHTLDVKQGQVINDKQANIYLTEDLKQVEQVIAENVRVPLNQNQFDALASFIFNLGGGAFKRSTLLKKLNQGDYSGAALEFNRWVHAGKTILPGLVRRRKTESELFGS